VGYVSWEKHGCRFELVALAVRTGFRRLGFGTHLLLLAMRAAVQAGSTELILQVRPGNLAAQALYEKYGFEAVAVLPKYYQRGRRPGVLMQHSLGPDAKAYLDAEDCFLGSRKVTGLVEDIQVSASSYDAWNMLAEAMRQALPAVRSRSLPLREVVEMPEEVHSTSRCGYQLQGYNIGDGRVLICLKGSKALGFAGNVASYAEILATLLHELVHFKHLGHRPVFYEELGNIIKEVGGEHERDLVRWCRLNASRRH